MMGKPPPSPPGVARKLDAVELRMGNLRRELDAETDASIKAAILYHMGSLYEHELGRASDAVDHYGKAFEVSPSFQPAAMARMRLAERARDDAGLEAMCRAHAEAAKEPSTRASASLDLALRSDDWASLLRDALDQSADPVVPALVLEWLAEAHRDSEALRHALRTQAEHASDPTLRSALWVDLALAEIDDGSTDAALHALELACESDALAWSARALQRRVARESERWDVLVSASVWMARSLQSEAAADPLALSIPEEERLPMAAMLWHEAATYSEHALGDRDAAAEYLASALRLCPEDQALRRDALVLAEHRAAPDALEEAAAWFRAAAPSDPTFVSREIRAALGSDEHQSALDFLREVAAHYPDSELAQAALEVALLRAAASAERIERLRQSAEAHQGEARARLLWRAARVAAATDPSSGEAQTLFSDAASAAPELRATILRDAWGTALLARDGEMTIRRSEELLTLELEPEELALLSFCRYDVARNLLDDQERASTLLRQALSDPHGRRWAPSVALVLATADADLELLAEAREALAEASEGEKRAVHLREAGRARALAGDWDAAERVLRAALDEAGDDARSLALLEGVLREGGHPEKVVTLARAQRGTPAEASLGEDSLLLAGATAERSGDLSSARRAYEEALERSANSAAAALALGDVARRMGDDALRLRASALVEQAELGGGVSELVALLCADTSDGASVDAPACYERALGHPITSSSAAAALLSTPRPMTTEEQRAAAEEILADAGASLNGSGNGFSTAFSALRDSLGKQGSSTGDAWLQLASLAPNESLRAGALLQGLREIRVDQGDRAIDELFMLAQEAEGLAASHPEAAIAIDEVLAPGDDPELRAATLRRKLDHSAELGRGALDAAHSRALVEAERGAEAVVLLSRALDERPDDLASWET